MRNYKTYLILCTFIATLLCLTLLGNLIFITNSHENISFNKLVREQQKAGAIWGSALNPNIFIYKYELYKYLQPEILALGSSSAYQFRKEFFHKSFANSGGVMVGLNYGRAFLEEIIKIHKPQLIILCVDFWYFNDKYPLNEDIPAFKDTGTYNLIYKLRQPFVWFWERKITLGDYLNIVLHNNNKNKISNLDNLGVLAIKRADGFRQDGSYYYGELTVGFRKKFSDKKFQTSLRHVENGTERFTHGENLSAYSVNELDKIIRLCQENNIRIVVILPPVSSTLYKKMQGMPNEYRYIEKLRKYIRSLPIEAYDFFDITEVGSGDCECIDGFHTGDVTAQRMLLTILQRNPQTVVREYVNDQLMRKCVQENAGKVLVKFKRELYNFDEVDFLEIGCCK